MGKPMLSLWQYGSLPFGFAQGRDFRRRPMTAMTRDVGDVGDLSTPSPV